MPYVPVPKDLNKVKTKVALNLTKRQLICFGSAAAIGFPTYLLTRPAIGTEGAVLLMMGLMLPCFFLAMFERDGQPAEKIIRNFLRTNLWPGTRPYRTENLYTQIEKEGCSYAKNKAAGAAGKTPARRPAKRKKQQG